MLVFVVPLKSARVAKSWDYVSLLFERCLRSICAQTTAEFKVLVLHHERPAIAFNHPAVTYVRVELPVPDPRDHTALNQDKFRKRFRGFLLARELAATHMMNVDADDCVSNRLAAWVREHPTEPGWYFDSGYFYRDRARTIFLKRGGFHFWCGTSHIFRRDLVEVPPGTEAPDGYLSALRADRLRCWLAPLSFPGAIYVNTKGFEGNHSRRDAWSDYKANPKIALHRVKKRIDELFRGVPVTAALREEFGLYPLDQRWRRKMSSSEAAR
jgi:hypothetical protein